jgi:2-C-methyl-D-erythritol 2,4-cyclodiphosphate synthase
MPNSQRIGYGVDFHRFKRGRRFILGGVDIPFSRGLDGHSDADALLHAVCDALLGAAGLDDIGSHFPDTDPDYKGISSLVLLRKTAALLKKNKCVILNIDTVILLQKPRIGPYRDRMRRNIAAAVSLPPDRVNVKATTTEKMGFIGKGEGIECRAVALVKK